MVPTFPALFRYDSVLVRENEGIQWLLARGYGTQPFDEESVDDCDYQDKSSFVSLLLTNEESFYLCMKGYLLVAYNCKVLSLEELWQCFIKVCNRTYKPSLNI